jgi:uncharacterized damage-inducible protein DinB
MDYALVTNYAGYNLWANQTLIEWLNTKPAELFAKEVPSSFSGILKTLNHIWATEEFWYAVMSGHAPGNNNRYYAQDLNTNEVIQGLLEQSATLFDFVNTLSETALLQKVYLDAPWVKSEMPRYEFLHHVLNHSTYHRRQIVTIGRNLKFTDAPMTDYNFFNMALRKMSA